MTAAARIKATRPFSPFEWMLALRYLRPRRKAPSSRSSPASRFLGIMLGVATLVVVMAVMNGFRAELLDKILGINGHIIVQPIESDAHRLRRGGEAHLRGARACRRRFRSSRARRSPPASTSGGSGVLVRGIRGADLLSMREDRQASVKTAAALDRFRRFRRRRDRHAASPQSLGVTIGDKVTLITPRGAVTPLGTTPRVKSYPVVAIFEIGMSEYDSTFVFMPLAEAQVYFNSPRRGAGDRGLSRRSRSGRGLPPDGRGGRQAPGLHHRLAAAQRHLLHRAAGRAERDVPDPALIILVAALNIISGLIMLVKDKGHDIAILRTMGATRGAILRVFFITGASIGTVGTLVGLCARQRSSALNIESIRQSSSRWITAHGGLLARALFPHPASGRHGRARDDRDRR